MMNTKEMAERVLKLLESEEMEVGNILHILDRGVIGLRILLDNGLLTREEVEDIWDSKECELWKGYSNKVFSQEEVEDIVNNS
jgi:hypothetical protein